MAMPHSLPHAFSSRLHHLSCGNPQTCLQSNFVCINSWNDINEWDVFSCKHSLMGWRQHEFAFFSLPMLYFRIRLQHCGSQHMKVAAIWDCEFHRMQFLFLNSWIGWFHKTVAKQNWCSVIPWVCSWRRFLFHHLAHIKHILSEVVKLKYVRCWDSYLQRNKWDLCISLLPMPTTLNPPKG